MSYLHVFWKAVHDGNSSSHLFPADHHRFNPSLSSPFRNNGQTYTLSYRSGSLSVVLGYDTMTVSDVLRASEGLGFSSHF